jgi:hypothetical protein
MSAIGQISAADGARLDLAPEPKARGKVAHASNPAT